MLQNPIDEMCEAFGIERAAIAGVSVLVLPEGAGDTTRKGEIYDTEDSIFLAKAFKSDGLVCKTAFDLGLRPKIKDRRGFDVWLGVVWILDKIAVPIVVRRLSDWLNDKCAKNHQYDSTPIDSPTVHIELFLQDDDRRSALRFDGSVKDFVKLASGLKELEKEE